MPLNIRDPVAQELAREVATATGETMTQAVITALQERLERLQHARAHERSRRAARLMEHGKRFSALPVEDPRSPDEILGYDDAGLPT